MHKNREGEEAIRTETEWAQERRGDYSKLGSGLSVHHRRTREYDCTGSLCILSVTQSSRASMSTCCFQWLTDVRKTRLRQLEHH